MVIHCVRHASDMETLCGEQGMVPAMDLYTRAWQGWRMEFPDQGACAECEKLWRPIAQKMEAERFAENEELRLLERGGEVASCLPHKQEVEGSSPSPASK